MSEEITDHYSFGGLHQRIEKALADLDIEPTAASLGTVDEFHVGGRPATAHLIDQLVLNESDHVLDIGSGLGGTARYITSQIGARVTGVDLTAEYVEVATWLTGLVGLEDRVTFIHSSAADLSAVQQSFSAATMVHVGMNIADKETVFGDIAGRLPSGARFAIYDLMVTGEGRPDYPVPWASSSATSDLETVQAYHSHLEGTGFEVEVTQDRTEAAMAAFAQHGAGSNAGAGVPALGLNLVMGPTTATKLANLRTAVADGVIAPTEIIAIRR